MYDEYDAWDGGYDEFNDWDATQCANGDYNAWEEERVFQDGVLERADEEDACKVDEALDVWGERARCRECDSVAHIVDSSKWYQRDTLHCFVCEAEWMLHWHEDEGNRHI